MIVFLPVPRERQLPDQPWHFLTSVASSLGALMPLQAPIFHSLEMTGHVGGAPSSRQAPPLVQGGGQRRFAALWLWISFSWQLTSVTGFGPVEICPPSLLTSTGREGRETEKVFA